MDGDPQKDVQRRDERMAVIHAANEKFRADVMDFDERLGAFANSEKNRLMTTVTGRHSFCRLLAARQALIESITS